MKMDGRDSMNTVIEEVFFEGRLRRSYTQQICHAG